MPKRFARENSEFEVSGSIDEAGRIVVWFIAAAL
jgi:hypothetical protein